jgi:hydroxypyruvate isomerase
MPELKPSVCIDAVLGHHNAGAALEIVAAAGIGAFEFWGWWDRDLSALAAARDKHGLAIASCCTKFVSLVDAKQRDEYLQGLAETIETAKRLGVRKIISQVGDLLPDVSRQHQHESLVAGLKSAAPMLAAADITLVIEPLNELVDHVGYYLVKSDEAFEIIDKVASPNVKVVFDIYHQQISEGQLIANIENNIDKIAHFHAAGNPGRNELTRGEINYPAVFEAIRKTGYDGYVGLEYWPVEDPLVGLQQVAKWF